MAANSSTVWQRGRVLGLRDLAQNIRRIVIEPESPLRAAPGTHVDIAVVVNGQRDVRSYSVVDSDDDGTRLALSVFRTPASRGGSVFMHGLAEGDEVELTQPMQNFHLRVGRTPSSTRPTSATRPSATAAGSTPRNSPSASPDSASKQ